MHKENLRHFIVSYYFILELNIFNSTIDKISFLCYSCSEGGRYMKFSGHCPICREPLRLARLACTACKAEFPIDEPLSPYDYLSDEYAQFLQAFLACRGNMKDVQNKLGISYPTAKRKLDELLMLLGLSSIEDTEEEFDMSLLKKIDRSSEKVSEMIRSKLYENGGKTTVYSITGKPYIIKAANDGRSFLCNELPITPPYTYEVFDVIVDFLKRQGGKARKGNGRNYRLGEGDCAEDTVVWAIGKNYFKAADGTSVVDPVFVLAAVLDWAGIAHNERGYLTLTAEYLAKISG